MQPSASWSIWVDTGGTFTDCVAVAPDGGIRRLKVLSNGSIRGRLEGIDPSGTVEVSLPAWMPDGLLRGWQLRSGADGSEVTVVAHEAGRLTAAAPLDVRRGDPVELRTGEEAAVLAARLATHTRAGEPLPPMDLRVATTRGTNALLERTGARVALFLTAGFRDLLVIGNQQRPDLFARAIVKPVPLYERVVEVPERLSADGSVLRPLDLEALEGRIGELVDDGITTAAVGLLHSYHNPEHERRLAAHLLRRGFRHVSVSSELAPLIRYLPRAETAVVDAYLGPVMEGFVGGLRERLGAVEPKIMTSAGGLAAASRFRAKDSLLSGPAGGVVGAAGAGRRSGVDRVIAFDMGGTSTDVSRFDGEYDYRYETRVGSAHLMSPSLAIETVAAGGGSICGFDGTQLRVGPESAGADPGPACYGVGGPLTVTDVNLLLGRLLPDRFEIPIDAAQARARAEEVLAAVRVGEPELELETLLAGFLRIANERMAEAVRRISVREGYDPTEYTLVAFGGAGAQHACALADLLDVGHVLVPEDASLLSAWGLGHAVVERIRERQVLEPLIEVEAELGARFDELAAVAAQELAAEGVSEDSMRVRLRRCQLRLVGQDATLPVDYQPGALRDRFGEAYRAVYGYLPRGPAIEVESLRVVVEAAPATRLGAPEPRNGDSSEPVGSVSAYVAGDWRRVPIFERQRLSPAHEVSGPALIAEPHSATFVEPGWSARLDRAWAISIRRGDDDV